MKKVLIISSYPAPYRVKVFAGLAKEYKTEIYFDTVHNEERNPAWYYKSSDFSFDILDNEKSKRKFHFALKNIKKYRFVIAYDPSRKPAIEAIGACIVKKIPYYVNNDGAFIKPNFLKDIIKRIIYSKATACFSSGKSATAYFKYYGIPDSKIYEHKFSSLSKEDIIQNFEIANRAKIRSYLGLVNKITVISVGQFIQRKGFDILLKAWATIPETAQLYIIGGGSELHYYENIIDKYNLHNVYIKDFMPRQELFKYYQASDVFVFPTREDVWGLVINEAMASGLPIISTDRCNAALELVENGINGYIVPVGDISNLAKYIKLLINDKKKNLEMSLANIEKIKDYTIDNIVNSHINTIRMTLGERR